MFFENKIIRLQKFKLITVYIFGIFYINIGLSHFINPDFFLVIMPEYLPYPLFLVYLSGFFEVLFGFLLFFEKTRNFSSVGLALLLLFVFPANIHLYLSEEAQEMYQISKNKAITRMFFQIPLIMIAIWHSINKSYKNLDKVMGIVFVVTLIYFISLSL